MHFNSNHINDTTTNYPGNDTHNLDYESLESQCKNIWILRSHIERESVTARLNLSFLSSNRNERDASHDSSSANDLTDDGFSQEIAPRISNIIHPFRDHENTINNQENSHDSDYMNHDKNVNITDLQIKSSKVNNLGDCHETVGNKISIPDVVTFENGSANGIESILNGNTSTNDYNQPMRHSKGTCLDNSNIIRSPCNSSNSGNLPQVDIFNIQIDRNIINVNTNQETDVTNPSSTIKLTNAGKLSGDHIDAQSNASSNEEVRSLTVSFEMESSFEENGHVTNNRSLLKWDSGYNSYPKDLYLPQSSISETSNDDNNEIVMTKGNCIVPKEQYIAKPSDPLRFNVRDFAIDHKTNQIFNEFVKIDPNFKGKHVTKTHSSKKSSFNKNAKKLHEAPNSFQGKKSKQYLSVPTKMLTRFIDDDKSIPTATNCIDQDSTSSLIYKAVTYPQNPLFVQSCSNDENNLNSKSCNIRDDEDSRKEETDNLKLPSADQITQFHNDLKCVKRCKKLGLTTSKDTALDNAKLLLSYFKLKWEKSSRESIEEETEEDLEKNG
ncbi:unnamed protein product [Gordionus sp. m RMFG-2023]|uniref:asparagine-rich protein-like isoform X2 n=1 Tax=Gordionus sp. m RMFG-2023 TaxID=3053472 RepID=UPI0030E3B03A